MNIFQFKKPTHVSWAGDHAGSVDGAWLVVSCADDEIAKVTHSLATARAGAEVHRFEKPTFVHVDCGVLKHADETRVLVISCDEDHAREMVQALLEVHRDTYNDVSGRLHWQAHASAGELAAHAAGSGGTPLKIANHRRRVSRRLEELSSKTAS